MAPPKTTTVTLTRQDINALMDALNLRDTALATVYRHGGPAMVEKTRKDMAHAAALADRLLDALSDLRDDGADLALASHPISRAPNAGAAALG